MDVLALIVAIAALIIAVLAFRRTGGIDLLRADLESASEALGRTAHAARERTADLLEQLEGKIREEREERDEREEGAG